MSALPNVRYGFLPFLRTGLATRLEATTLAAATPRSTITVSVTASQVRDDNANATVTVPKTVNVRGPGDITAFDSRVIIRTDPKPDVGDFEANYFPTCDFSAPDFPWRFTPVGPSGSRLRPWITLIVLEAGEFTPPKPRGALATITVKRDGATLADILPDLDEAWAWAHVQVTDALDDATVIDFSSATQLGQLVASHPELAIARLMCPRRLKDNTGYTAFVVPTFEAGRLAGLQMPAEQVRGDQLAWDPAVNEVELPVYHHWSFRTGARGDFEFLVRALVPYRIPGHVGLRDVDAGHPGPMVPAISNPAGRPEPVLGFQGALQSLDTEPTRWPDPARAQPDPFQSRLSDLLNAAADDPNDDPFVMPPIYGRWHAAVTRVGAAGPRWINTLNLDPRHRATAGYGTQVVQADQESLMASAWRQIGDLDLASDALRAGQVGRAISERVAVRHLETRFDEEYLVATRAFHGKVLGSSTTIRRQLASTALRSAALSPSFARLTRPASRLVRRAAAGNARFVLRDLLARINRRDLRVDPPAPIGGVITLDALRSSSILGTLPAWLQSILASPWSIVLLLLLMLLLAFLPLGWIVALAILLTIALVGVADARRPGPRFARRFTSTDVRSAAPPPSFDLAPVQLSWTGAPQPPPPGGAPSAQLRQRQVDAFRSGAARALEVARPEIPRTPPPAPADVLTVRQKLATALDPATTIAQAVLARLEFRVTMVRPADPLDPIWDHPKFPQPMYEPLARMSQELMLPGIGGIPVNSCGLVVTNQPFIEAYMVGLNHEMSRELLWREYPTDQRGSYFRQFWDVSARGALPPEDSPERDALRDIRPIHEWRSGDLGAHRPGTGPQEENVVLLVRGDLLKKYPNTVIYSARAGWVSTTTETYRAVPEGAEERRPIFRGELRPDVGFIGFKLTETEVRGDPGWFFILEEQFTQPRFGMDVGNGAAPPIAKWSDLSWNHFAGAQPPSHVPVDGAPNAVKTAAVAGGPAWGTSAAALAAITLQQPVRIMVHGSQMVPMPPAQGTEGPNA
ncbi:MAG TPA: hypothetical protein VJ802_18080 [Gemmatimonadaceae bacterium]|nr:hypothetical protein [Gemmatimonadaceae bacterium]